MQQPREIRQKVLSIIEPVCEGSGYELVDLSYQRESNGWVVRVFIDNGDGTVGFQDCEKVSRELSAVLDVEDPIPTAYSLEVSSPGVERPLRTEEHFVRFAGQEAKVVLEEGVDGRRNYRGIINGADDGHILITVDGNDFRLPLVDLKHAKLIVDWDDVLRQGRVAAKGQPN
jgi:ribosome maturation factor RimP